MTLALRWNRWLSVERLILLPLVQGFIAPNSANSSAFSLPGILMEKRVHWMLILRSLVETNQENDYVFQNVIVMWKVPMTTRSTACDFRESVLWKLVSCSFDNMSFKMVKRNSCQIWGQKRHKSSWHRGCLLYNFKKSSALYIWQENMHMNLSLNWGVKVNFFNIMLLSENFQYCADKNWKLIWNNLKSWIYENKLTLIWYIGRDTM